MQPGVRNPQGYLSSDNIAAVGPKPWQLADLENTVDVVMKAFGVERPEETIRSTAFACLAEPPCRWIAFAVGMLVQAALLLILTNVTFFALSPTLNQVDMRNLVHLVAPDLLQAPADRNRKAMVLKAPAPQPVKPSTLELRIPRDTPPLILPSKLLREAEKAMPPVTQTPAATPAAFREPELAAASLVTQAAVSTKFGGNSGPAAEGKSARQVQTGGFGDRYGVQVSDASAANGPMLARVGAFDMPKGPGSGNGTGGVKGVRSTSASVNFGNASDGQIDSRALAGRATVRLVNFGSEGALAPPAPRRHAVTLPAANETPVLLLTKPLLAYTPEARRNKIEGDVELDVVFAASGQVSVLRVVQGLGFGLDEEAISAAQQIRFTPARREGQPVDSHGLLRMIFRLS